MSTVGAAPPAPPIPANITDRLDLRPSADVEHNKKLLPHRAKLFFFCNMTIEPLDMRLLYSEPHFFTQTRRWQSAVHNIERWRLSLQRKIWGSPWFREYVRNQVVLYNKSQRPDDSAYGEDTSYDSMTLQEIIKFWKDPSRFTYANIVTIFNPLKQAINISTLWNDARWSCYLRKIFVVACHSTWAYRGRLEDEAYADDIAQRQREIYQIIREVPNRFAFDRPFVVDVPLAAGLDFDVSSIDL